MIDEKRYDKYCKEYEKIVQWYCIEAHKIHTSFPCNAKPTTAVDSSILGGIGLLGVVSPITLVATAYPAIKLTKKKIKDKNITPNRNAFKLIEEEYHLRVKKLDDEYSIK